MARVVYSTDQGRLCPNCGKSSAACSCKKMQSIPEGDGIVLIQRETKGRKGKGVTIVSGLPLTEKDMKVLAKSLKQLCGTGGSVKNGRIEIQGDQRSELQTALQKKGYQVKLSGG